MTNEANEMKCQSKSKRVECSTNDPHMFTVDGERVECLNHAVRSEQLGRRVELILT